MSPRSNPTRSPSAPYTRRAAGQPKSSRQQFSACGACRMRRVRCDLKDLSPDIARPHPACSNCKERGLKCVDEFADVKAVKLLRRGRRLQQVEAIYGKTADPEQLSPSPSSTALSPGPRTHSAIPALQLEFFSSPFWSRFMMQRPILDPTEFPARFLAHSKGSNQFGNEARIIAMLLVVWAASFGVDERGVEEAESEPLDNTSSRNGRESAARQEILVERRRRETRERTDAMVREVLTLIDAHGVMRRPTWDGVRVLLLILPLMHEVQPPLDRQIIYEATLSQIHALSALASLPSGSYGSDMLIKARVFWYAYIHESMSSGLRGGRLVLDGDDLDNFQHALPPFVGVGGDLAPSLPSPISPTFPSPNPPPLLLPMSHHQQRPQHSSPSQSSFLPTPHLFALPLLLSGVCRKVHAVLTGRRAQARANGGVGIVMEGLGDIWDGLNRCWDEFEALRRTGGIGQTEEEIERYVAGWQIFIFECHNIIRESLKQHILSSSPPGSTSSHSNHSPNHSHPSPHHLHSLATGKCIRILPRVLRIIRMHIATNDREGSGLFRWDAGLVRDGCFFAGYLAAGGESRETADGADGFSGWDFKDDDGLRMSPEESVDICLRALSEMQWAFSKAEEREQTVRMVWDTRQIRGRAMREYHGQIDMEGDSSASMYHQPQQHPSYEDHNSVYSGKSHHHHAHAHVMMPLVSDRLPLRPLSLTLSPRPTLMGSTQGSAPNTACTDGSASGWPSYTPPGTATSGSGSGNGGSPDYSAAFVKGEVVNDYYHHAGVSVGDLDPFSFSVGTEGVVGTGYHTSGRGQSQAHSTGGSSGYRDGSVVFCAPGSTVMAHRHVHGSSDDGCQFGDDCGHGFYH